MRLAEVSWVKGTQGIVSISVCGLRRSKQNRNQRRRCWRRGKVSAALWLESPGAAQGGQRGWNRVDKRIVLEVKAGSLTKRGLSRPCNTFGFYIRSHCRKKRMGRSNLVSQPHVCGTHL